MNLATIPEDEVLLLRMLPFGPEGPQDAERTHLVPRSVELSAVLDILTELGYTICLYDPYSRGRGPVLILSSYVFTSDDSPLGRRLSGHYLQSLSFILSWPCIALCNPGSVAMELGCLPPRWSEVTEIFVGGGRFADPRFPQVTGLA